MPAAPEVIVHVLGPLRAYCRGKAQLAARARTVHELIEHMERAEPRLYINVCDETGAVRRHLNVFVNATHMRDLDGIDTSLAPGDVVTFLPAVSGG